MSAPADRQELVRGLLKALISAFRSRTFYPVRHPTVAASLTELERNLEGILAGSREVVLAAIARDLIVDGRPFIHDVALAERFRQELADREIDKITLSRGIRPEDCEALVEAFAMAPERLRALGGMAAALAERGVRGVQIGRIGAEAEDEPVGEGDAWREASSSWQQGLAGMREITERIRAGRGVDAGATREVASALVQGLRGRRGPMLAALALRRKSPYTFSHSLNVALLLLAQVEMLDLPAELLQQVATAGLLHDIGKLRIPDEIINKVEPLTDAEWTLIRLHPVYAVEVMRTMDDPGDLAVIVAFEHHLRHDRTGYPPLHAPWPLNRISELAAIADCYDAMRSRRPYDAEWPCERVHRRMTELAGTAFNATMLERFFRIVGVYPPGTRVRLTSGAVGTVVRTHPALPDCPVVEIRRGPDGEALERPLVIDLAVERERRGGEALAVEGSVLDEAPTA